MTLDERALDVEVRRDVTALVTRIRATWPEGSLTEVDGDLEYGQWGEAVSNLMAVRERDGLSLAEGDLEAVDDLIDRMGIRGEVEAAVRYAASRAT